jgi:hypothetical protein
MPAADALLRFSGAAERDPAIDAWLAGRPPALAPMARAWFERLRRCGDDVRELMHDGLATVCVGDAPFAYVGAFTAHVDVGFFRGAALADPAGLLEGKGKRMRHVKIRPGVAFDAPALEALVEAAHRDMVERVEEQSRCLK